MKNYKGRMLNTDIPVEVYRCLNRKGKSFSVRQEGKVIGHDKTLDLHNCEFVVNKAGKRRCITTRERNVHAFIRGHMHTTDGLAPIRLVPRKTGAYHWMEVYYNPYSPTNFYAVFETETPLGMVETHEEITSAKYIFIKKGVVYATMINYLDK